jgi:hypothetical protein
MPDLGRTLGNPRHHWLGILIESGQAALKNPVGNNLPQGSLPELRFSEQAGGQLEKIHYFAANSNISRLSFSGIPRGIDTRKVGARVARLR